MQKLTGFNGEFLLKAGTASLNMIGPQTETQGEYSVCKSRRQHQAEHCSSQISDEDLHHAIFNCAADLGCVERSGICNEIQDSQLCWLVPEEQTRREVLQNFDRIV